jgi:hypothetical protein
MEPQKIKGCLPCAEGIGQIRIIILFLTLMVSISQRVSAQRIWEVRKGCVRTQGNLGGGYLFSQKAVSAYFNGEMEVFFDDRFAYTGAMCASFLTNRKNDVGLKANHAIFAGANYHFLKPKRWDPYIGLTPGVGLVRAAYRNGDELKKTPFTLAPLISAQIGCNFYVCSFLHFFVKVQGVAGQMFSTLPTPQRLDEMKFMGGLGWNLRLWKPKVRDTWGKQKS